MASPPVDNLFGDDAPDLSSSLLAPDPDAPLAARMRPRTLDEFSGQSHVIGAGSGLRRAIERDQLSSVLFWGPPGSGKSTLAQIIARTTKAAFENYSAITSGVADIRKVITQARERKAKFGQKTILFVDEIHRWNKAQQDALLPHVENGIVVLIGATTENPYFEVNAPLLSRSRLYRFERLTEADIRALLDRALTDTERGLGGQNLRADEDAVAHLARIAGGDARRALTALEAAASAAPSDEDGIRTITLALAEEAAQARTLAYDKDGDEHFDTISAFIKSIRGSDPDAALYWLAKMLLAGEDVKFIARRLVILASEDVGNADPMALVLANAAAQAVQFIGLPEARLTLSQAVTYLAAAPKSNAATIAIGRATEELKTHGARPVPLPLRDSHYPGGKAMGHGKDYLYPHDFPGHYVAQQYLPDGVTGTPFYEPTDQGVEVKIARRMQERLTPQLAQEVEPETGNALVPAVNAPSSLPEQIADSREIVALANVEIVSSDLLAADVEALVNAVNCVGVMGKGIALAFKQAYPSMFRVYRAACKSGEVRIGQMHVWETGLPVNPKYVVNFPTVQHWGDRSRLEDIETGLQSLVQEVQSRNIASIAIPALGCGAGKLDWNEVRPRIEAAFAVLPNVRVLLYAPAPHEKENVHGTFS